MMGLTVMLLVAAVVGSLVLVQRKPLALAVVALIASGLQLAFALRWTRFSIPGIPLSLVLACTLALVGWVLLFRARAKWEVSAATVVALVGTIRALTALDLLQ